MIAQIELSFMSFRWFALIQNILQFNKLSFGRANVIGSDMKSVVSFKINWSRTTQDSNSLTSYLCNLNLCPPRVNLARSSNHYDQRPCSSVHILLMILMKRTMMLVVPSTLLQILYSQCEKETETMSFWFSYDIEGWSTVQTAVREKSSKSRSKYV